MSNTQKEDIETEGIFIGKPSKEDLINYFMKQQRIATIKKMEEIERDSPDLSESFEIYLEQKKKKIEIEKNKLDNQQTKERKSQIPNAPGEKNISINSSTRSFPNDLSYNNDSFTELEKMCENTLNLNNVSEVLADLTSLELKNDSNAGDLHRINLAEETKIHEIEQPSLFLNNSSLMSNDDQSSLKHDFDNNSSTVMEATAMSLSYKTTHSHFPQSSVMSSDKSEYYRTANDKSFELTKSITNDHSFKFHEQDNESSSFNTGNKSNQPESSPFNDTLDEIDFLLSQAQKLNNQKDVLKTAKKESPAKHKNSPMMEKKPRAVHSPLISFSPITDSKSPSANFKHPKPVSLSKNLPQFSKINNKKFQHIVSPVSRYIQTSESVLNANAHVNYKGTGAKRHFNFRDSENFDQSHDISVKASSLPLRAKTNTVNTPKSSEKQTPQDKYKFSSPITNSRKENINLPRERGTANFFDNTFNDL